MLPACHVTVSAPSRNSSATPWHMATSLSMAEQCCHLGTTRMASELTPATPATQPARSMPGMSRIGQLVRPPLQHETLVRHHPRGWTCVSLTTPIDHNQITSLQRTWKVLVSFCKRCVKTSWGRQCVEFSLRPQNDLKKRCAGTLTGRSGDVVLHWWRPGNVARKFCFHKIFPGTLSESFVSNRIVCFCSVNVV